MQEPEPDISEELISEAINDITEKVSEVMLMEFLKLPQELQMNMILIKSAQLLQANILCHVASNRQELDDILALQADEMRELTLSCAATGFSEKFEIHKH